MKLPDGYNYQIFSWCVLLSFHLLLKVYRSATYYFRRPSYFYADDTVALQTVCKCSLGKISMRFLHLCCNSTLKAILQFDLNMVLTQDITVADKNKTCLKFIGLILYSVVLNAVCSRISHPNYCEILALYKFLNVKMSVSKLYQMSIQIIRMIIVGLCS